MRSPGASLYHGKWWELNQQDSLDRLTAGRFTKLFPNLPPAEFDPDDLQLLADEMTPRQRRRPAPKTGLNPEEDREITAAYTYLGQFVDHDITFDPTSRLREYLDREQIGKLADFRTPRFDLDSIYGRGPDDQPYLYAPDGIRMLLGERMSGNPHDPHACQVPRGPNGRALIGDPRNDENRIVSQLHAIFLRFHNQVADYLTRRDQLGAEVSFDDVREQVRWHYQWLLVTDFLPTVIEKETFRHVFGDPYNPVPGTRELRTGLNLMPVEFSVAAYRFGHSMIRPEYQLNMAVERPIFSRHTGEAADLGGFRRIPSNWAIDWQFFINLGDDAAPAAAASPADPIEHRPQMASKIDTSLASPLRNLPARIASDPPMLALRNLERGNTFGLPSGQKVAEALGVEPISDENLLIGRAATDAHRKPLTDIARSFAGKAPLWAYILSEAQVMSWKKAQPGISPDDIPIKLGPVGSRIITDVFAALLIGDRTSYLYSPDPFRPIATFSRNGAFGLAELINVALGHTQ
jgi:hypothetical protein